MSDHRAKDRAYKRALGDLKEVHPAEFELLYQARLASLAEDDAKPSTARPSRHVMGDFGRCAYCKDKWPCRTAQKRISRQRRAQEGG